MREMFVIFGDPVSHSKSPLMHNLAFKGLGYGGCYTRYRLKDGSALKEKFFELKIKGANVTVPHKEEAFLACDELDGFARRVRAVNTIVKRDDRLYGYNTDAPGFLKVIEGFEGIKKVLFLGAGGTAQSTSIILKDAKYDVTILNRSEKRLEWFKDMGFDVFTFENFENDSFDLVVNMTSAGLNDDMLPSPIEILQKVLSKARASIDVIYGKETPFLRLSKDYNIPTKDGSDMLLYQGIIAFEHFCDHKFSFDEVEKFMKRAF